MTNPTNDLYNHGMAQAAAAAHNGVVTRHAAATARHAAAEGAHAEATRLLGLAIAGDGDAIEAEKALRETELALSVSVKMRDYAATARDASAVKFAQVKSDAARPIVEAGLRAIYQASSKHDAANELLKQADADRAAGVRLAMTALSYGVNSVGQLLDIVKAHIQLTAAERAALMRGTRICPLTGGILG